MNRWLNNQTFLDSIPKKFIDELNTLDFCDEISVYKKSELYERNITNQVDKYLPDYFIFADDGGDVVYIRRFDPFVTDIYSVDVGDMSILGKKAYAKNLTEFYKLIMTYEEDDKCETNHKLSLEWSYFEEGDLKILLKIKKILELDFPVNELLKISKNLPSTIKEDISDIHANYYMKELGEYAKYFRIKG